MARLKALIAAPLGCLAAMLFAPGIAGGLPQDRPAAPPPPSAILQRVGIDQKLDQQVPLDLPFRDEQGRTVQLGQYFSGKPVVLVLVYYGCPSLCTVTLNNLVGALRAVPMDVGKDFEVLTVSFDPTETPQLAGAKKRNYLKRYARPGAENGWHFLTGDAEPIRQLTHAVGFRYAYDERTRQYAHGSVVMVLTPQGKLSRYLYGLEHSPKDLRLALVEASNNKIGSVVDRALLLCYRYDPATNRYGFVVITAIRAGGVLTVAVLGAYIVTRVWRERRSRSRSAKLLASNEEGARDA